MQKKKKKLKSDNAEHEFWSKNDLTDYLNDYEILDAKEFSMDPNLSRQIKKQAQKKHLVAIRLDDTLYSLAQQLAVKKSLGLSSLLRSWIAQGIRREIKTT